MATLGNLCVDIVLNVPKLPSSNKEERKAFMEQLAASPPDKKYWEAGGNCNLIFAAARLGLRVFTLGHVGNEIYGDFLVDVLENEGVSMVGMRENSGAVKCTNSYETLLCWVLVDPFQKHDFCSRADFNEEPAFSWMTRLSDPVKKTIQKSKILFCNGYAFDEFYPELITSALYCAIGAGTRVFFDPGPRGKKLLNGTPDEKGALELFLKLSDVVLMTADEVEALTGIQNPIIAGQELIRKSERTKWIIVKVGSKGSLLITESSVSCAPSFKVDVVDTVGCGDSYTAAIAFGYLHNLPSIDTLALANAVGAATATGVGAGRNVATLGKVLKLLKQSNLNEDDEFWNKLMNKVEAKEIILLSGTHINGHGDQFVRVPIQNVVANLLPKLEIVFKYGRKILQS